LSQFKFFYDDWLDCSSLFEEKIGDYNDLQVNLPIDFFDSLRLDKDSIKQYRIKAASNLSETIGNKIGLCFSGGVDSQCMIQAFVEAKIDFDIYTLRFNNGLNSQDINHAIKYCEKFNLKLNIIDIDVLNFLSIHNHEYGIRYNSTSPHFNVHYKLFDILADKGYDGVVTGGNAPLFTTSDNLWGTNYNKNAHNYINYTKISGFKCQGNFLSYYPKLSWAIGLLTPPMIGYRPHKSNFSEGERLRWENLRYTQKIHGYRNAGFDVLPQNQKYTGFELVKKHLETKTNDGWTFEKLYRHPLERILIKVPGGIPRFTFISDKILDKINSIYSNNMLSSIGTSSGI
jgi:hypothetical protein